MRQAGKRDKRISIQKNTQTKGTSGGIKDSWSNFLTGVSASIRNKSGNERRATSHGGEVSEERVEFELDYRPGITGAMRVVYNGAYYNIRHVNNINEGNRTLLLTCDTGVNNG